MLLMGIQEQESWLMSRWNLTYPSGWQEILKATAAMYDYYDQVEILVDGQKINLADRSMLCMIPESKELTIRGMSQLVKTLIMVTFINQTKVVDVFVAKDEKNFAEADYQKFNMALCQYMDSIEIAMNR